MALNCICMNPIFLLEILRKEYIMHSNLSINTQHHKQIQSFKANIDIMKKSFNLQDLYQMRKSEDDTFGVGCKKIIENSFLITCLICDICG